MATIVCVMSKWRKLMKLSDLLLMSISNLWKRKLRTVLTVLGVVIGITSIVVMVALGNGLKESIMEEVTSYSSITQIQVESGQRWDASGNASSEEKLLNDEFVNMISGWEHVESVYPQLNVQVLAKSGKFASYLTLCGMSAEALESLNLPVKVGELPTDSKELKLFYGNSVITDFYVEKTGSYPYWENNTLPDIDIMKNPMFIIFDTNAYWSSKDSGNGNSSSSTTTPTNPPKKYIISACGIMDGEPDEWSMKSGNVYCNIDALKAELKRVFKKSVIPGQPTRKNGKPYNEIFYSTIVIQMDDLENVEATTKALQDMGYNANSDAEWIESQMNQLNTIQMVLGAIGAVALLVAAIGITNTMMMSIYERTKEIGVMKVLGCDIHNIQALFLMEAGFIGFIGGIIGVGFSYGLSVIINRLVDVSSMGVANICRIPVWLAPISILFAIFIGMIAGFLPSLRAMRLSPLAAIRNE